MAMQMRGVPLLPEVSLSLSLVLARARDSSRSLREFWISAARSHPQLLAILPTLMHPRRGNGSTFTRVVVDAVGGMRRAL